MGIKGSMPFLSIYSITTDKETEKKKEAEASFLKHNALQLELASLQMHYLVFINHLLVVLFRLSCIVITLCDFT